MIRQTSRWRTRLAAVTIAVLTLNIVGMPAAQADTSYPVTTSNASDPDIFECPYPGGGTTLCMFASADMTTVPAPYGPEKNYYPMNQTKLWRYLPGNPIAHQSGWVNMGSILNETALWSRGVPQNAYHLWAPSGRWLDNKYYLYVPDVKNRNDMSRSSRIFAFTSTDPVGVFNWTYQGEFTGPAGVNGGYASDPHLFVDFQDRRYLVFATGDASNCGSLAYGRLNDAMNGWRYGLPDGPIVINGVGALGSCKGTGSPYIEGASLYKWTEVGTPIAAPFSYVLIFAAKPTSVPSGCSTSNEVIAYATATQPLGPFTYQGIIMCGSTTEWTNQASVARDPRNNGQFLMAWHDGPDYARNAGYHARRTHLSCLNWNQTTFKIERIERNSNNLHNCTFR